VKFNEKNANIVFFNKGSLGKNPYCSCKLIDLKDKTVQAVYDNGGDSGEIQISGGEGECTIVGTHLQGQRNFMDTNYIFNIQNIDIRYDSDD
jgi:hypothetical protein